MRVLTLNLWNITEPLETRCSSLISGIKQLRPDIICFQEISHHPTLLRMQSKIIAEHCGFANHAYSFSGYCGEREEGLAVVSRYPIIRTGRVMLTEFPGDMARQVFLSELDCESRRMLVANTHLASPLHMERERAVQAAELLSAIKDYRDRSGAPSTILCGDFNDTPGSPAIRIVLDNAQAFFDTLAACNPESEGHTYSGRIRYVNVALGGEGRIDYIFASGGLQADCCEIVFDGRDDSDLVSDHFGVFCKFSVAGSL